MMIMVDWLRTMGDAERVRRQIIIPARISPPRISVPSDSTIPPCV